VARYIWAARYGVRRTTYTYYRNFGQPCQVFRRQAPNGVRHGKVPAVLQAVPYRGAEAQTHLLVARAVYARRPGSNRSRISSTCAAPVLAALTPTTEEALSARTDAQTYVTRNVARMDYPRFVAQQLPIGSGAVESACMCLVKARLKQAGMRWGVPSSQAIASLRAAQGSGRHSGRPTPTGTGHRRRTPPPPPRPRPPRPRRVPDRRPRNVRFSCPAPPSSLSERSGLSVPCVVVVQ